MFAEITKEAFNQLIKDSDTTKKGVMTREIEYGNAKTTYLVHGVCTFSIEDNISLDTQYFIENIVGANN